jgi:predicted methyltransferase
MRARPLLLSSTILCLLAACASAQTPVAESPPPAAEPAPAPAPAPPPANVDPGPYAAALAAPGRTDDDRARDARDRPAEVLALAGFGRGMTVADVFGGGGYYSEILSHVVGKDGRVLLVNNAPYDDFAKKGLAPRLADGRLANVAYSVAPNEALGLGTASLDGALIVMSYHDLYYADPSGGWPAIDAAQFIDQLCTALKPGARLLIVDHQARAGSGKDDTQALHRIEDAFAIADFRGHCFELERSTDLLRNPEDDHSKNVFDPAIRGKTDRFVHVYRKTP